MYLQTLFTYITKFNVKAILRCRVPTNEINKIKDNSFGKIDYIEYSIECRTIVIFLKVLYKLLFYLKIISYILVLFTQNLFPNIVSIFLISYTY